MDCAKKDHCFRSLRNISSHQLITASIVTVIWLKPGRTQHNMVWLPLHTSCVTWINRNTNWQQIMELMFAWQQITAVCKVSCNTSRYVRGYEAVCYCGIQWKLCLKCVIMRPRNNYCRKLNCEWIHWSWTPLGLCDRMTICQVKCSYWNQQPSETNWQLHWSTNFQKCFVSVMNMLLIYLFADIKLEKGHKNYLVLVLKLCYRYGILRNRLKYYTERWIK
jgi:hypothetical protein